MKFFIFGFQRWVWWPKWTPASSSWRIEKSGNAMPYDSFSGWTAAELCDRVLPGTGGMQRYVRFQFNLCATTRLYPRVDFERAYRGKASERQVPLCRQADAGPVLASGGR